MSKYKNSSPPITGIVHRWKFRSGVAEARAIAQSCKALIEKGVKHRQILILVSNRRVLLNTLKDELDAAGNIDVEFPSGARFVDELYGRFVFGVLRIACDKNRSDFIARRIILGTPKGVGSGTCNTIRQKTIDNNLNYLDIFYQPLPEKIFTGRVLSALNQARKICQQVSDWQDTDTLLMRSEAISQIIVEAFEQIHAAEWAEYIKALPNEMSLKELREYMSSDTDEQQASLLQAVYERLNLQIPAEGLLPPKIRIMTMHGVKGLNAQVVFIPGLEEGILPGSKQSPYPGLVAEAARLLYVSITRARAACIVSYAQNRFIYGKQSSQTASRFVREALANNGRFIDRDGGLSAMEAEQIATTVKAIGSID